MDKKTNEEKTCWSCKRSYLTNEGKLGLCPKCVNKYGSRAASLGALAIAYGGRQFLIHSGEIIERVAGMVKNNKS